MIGPAQVTFNAGENSTVIAHLSGTGALTASKFVNNLTPTPTNRARVSIFHTTNAPAVDFYLDDAVRERDSLPWPRDIGRERGIRHRAGGRHRPAVRDQVVP